jgi:hypothetical protein
MQDFLAAPPERLLAIHATIVTGGGLGPWAKALGLTFPAKKFKQKEKPVPRKQKTQKTDPRPQQRWRRSNSPPNRNVANPDSTSSAPSGLPPPSGSAPAAHDIQPATDVSAVMEDADAPPLATVQAAALAQCDVVDLATATVGSAASVMPTSSAATLPPATSGHAERPHDTYAATASATTAHQPVEQAAQHTARPRRAAPPPSVQPSPQHHPKPPWPTAVAAGPLRPYGPPIVKTAVSAGPAPAPARAHKHYVAPAAASAPRAHARAARTAVARPTAPAPAPAPAAVPAPVTLAAPAVSTPALAPAAPARRCGSCRGPMILMEHTQTGYKCDGCQRRFQYEDTLSLHCIDCSYDLCANCTEKGPTYGPDSPPPKTEGEYRIVVRAMQAWWCSNVRHPDGSTADKVEQNLLGVALPGYRMSTFLNLVTGNTQSEAWAHMTEFIPPVWSSDLNAENDASAYTAVLHNAFVPHHRDPALPDPPRQPAGPADPAHRASAPPGSSNQAAAAPPPPEGLKRPHEEAPDEAFYASRCVSDPTPLAVTKTRPRTTGAQNTTSAAVEQEDGLACQAQAMEYTPLRPPPARHLCTVETEMQTWEPPATSTPRACVPASPMDSHMRPPGASEKLLASDPALATGSGEPSPARAVAA